jgi:hypothetical protein
VDRRESHALPFFLTIRLQELPRIGRAGVRREQAEMISRVDEQGRDGTRGGAFGVLNNLRVRPPASKDLQFSPVGRDDRGVAESEWSTEYAMHNQTLGLTAGTLQYRERRNGVQMKANPPGEAS